MGGRVATNQDSTSRLGWLTEIARSLAGQRELNHLLESILTFARQATNADGGTVYRASDDGQRLTFDLVQNQSLALHLGGTSSVPANFAPMRLYDDQGVENRSSVVAYCALERRSVRIDDAYAAAGFDFQGAKRFDAANNYRSQSFLTVPMVAGDDQLIGVLQLINARTDDGSTTAFTEADMQFIEALASQAAIAIENKLLVDRLESLFFAFVNLINVAIDDKSPYTGGHCQRVPELTMMLADAASATLDGPLSSFTMTERDRAELLIAGLLHDCGKITTPVHVVDKSTKLETIYDRINLVETRLTALRREAEIESLKSQLAGTPVAAAEASLAAALAAIDDDMQFLRRVNIGQERMPDEDLDRIKQIATQQWTDATGAKLPLLTANELENLMVPYGTLTAVERQIINHHIVATNKMLEALPWPPHLRNVPEYAGGHHERMDGKGYPRGLTRDQMSVQARTMGIADIFEALTAADRPYKVGKTLTESLQILGRMAQSGHVDPDLFDIFVRKKVYLRYAERFLEPKQIDHVNEAAIPGYTP
jgi:HD-GYP domain-containing protein (c-di-GMP phosphodiesterase class II)